MAGEQLEEHNGISSGFVSFAGNDMTLDGYLTHPSDGQAHPGVILIQEWWGIEPHVKDLTERLARVGYVVLAPDLYHGRVVTEPDEAEKAMMALNKDVAVDEIIQAIGYLRGRSEVQPKQLGPTGFCMGGFLTWRTAERVGGVLAAIPVLRRLLQADRRGYPARGQAGAGHLGLGGCQHPGQPARAHHRPADSGE
jgi:carboxymethylenebutenolidase